MAKNKRYYKNNRFYGIGYDDGFDDGLGKGIRKSRNRIDNLINDLDKAERENIELTEKNTELQENNHELQVKSREMSVELENQRVELENQRVELENHRTTINNLKDEANSIKAEVHELEVVYADNLEEIETLGVETDELIAENEDIEVEIYSFKDKPTFSKSGKKRLSAMLKGLEEDKMANKKIIGRNQRRTNKLIKENEGVISQLNTKKQKSFVLMTKLVEMI